MCSNYFNVNCVLLSVEDKCHAFLAARVTIFLSNSDLVVDEDIGHLFIALFYGDGSLGLGQQIGLAF